MTRQVNFGDESLYGRESRLYDRESRLYDAPKLTLATNLAFITNPHRFIVLSFDL